jgi:GTP cyclohydrolase III
MRSANLEKATLNTREAYSALSHLKTLVESVANSIQEAERKTVGLAIGHGQKDDPIDALQSATETLRSQSFEAAVSEARLKTETAVACLPTVGG